MMWRPARVPISQRISAMISVTCFGACVLNPPPRLAMGSPSASVSAALKGTTVGGSTLPHRRHRRQAALQMRHDPRAVGAGVLDEDAVGPAAGLEGPRHVEAGDVRLAGLGIVR